MKNTMEGMNNRLLQVKETINEMEIREQENKETEEQKEKRISRSKKM